MIEHKSKKVDIRKCPVCKKVLRGDNKSGICSNCGTRTLGSLVREGIIKLENLHEK